MGLIGLSALVAGAVAVFVTDNGVGTAALIGVGAALILIAAIGHLSNIKAGGIEADFGRLTDELVETIDDAEEELVAVADAREEAGDNEAAANARERAEQLADASDRLKDVAAGSTENRRTASREAWRARRESEGHLISNLGATLQMGFLHSGATPTRIAKNLRASSTITWDLTVTWDDPPSTLFLDLQMVDYEMSRLRGRLNRSIERASRELITTGGGDSASKAVLLVFVPTFENEIANLAVALAQTEQIPRLYTMAWDGFSDSIARKAVEIRADIAVAGD